LDVVTKVLDLYGIEMHVDESEETKIQICINDLATVKELIASVSNKNSIFDLPECQESQRKIIELYVMHNLPSY
jgi:hypothetical protein